jgi:hypothetical protein
VVNALVMSQYGSLKHIIDLETLLGWRLSKIDFSCITDDSITYSWGDESELINWIRNKDANEQFGGNFYNISGSDSHQINKPTKYPLIWLVTPTTGVNEGDIKRFNGVQLIICKNTTESWLNAARWKEHFPTLQAIADKIIDKLRGDVRIVTENRVLKYSYRNVPKYSVSETGNDTAKQKALDIWDAVVITTDLLTNNSCRCEDYKRFCNK